MLNSPMLSIFQHFHAISLRSPLISLRSKWRLTGFSRRFTPKNPVRLHNPFGQLPRWGAKNVLPLNLIASFPAGRAYGGQDTVLLQIHLSGRTRETLIKSLSDLALVFSYKARNKPPRIVSYLRRVMTKHWKKNTCQVGLCDLISVSQRRTMLLCTHPQVGCTWGCTRNQNSLYKRIPRLAGSCKSGVFVSL